MKILVLSCDKNADLFEPFHHCMEKYWKNHPEIIYKTETVQNPYYKTLCADYPLSKWSKGTRKVVSEIDDDLILVMIDDCFIRKPVDTERIKYACEHIKGNTALFNFEKSFDINDIETDIEGFKLRQHGSAYELSIMCGLWQKDKFYEILNVVDADPWQIELCQHTCGFDYYINSGDYIIDWGYKTWNYAGVCKGRWCREVVDFFESEGITVDYSKRGFI